MFYIYNILKKLHLKISALYRSGLGESGVSEADSDVPGVKTLKNPIRNDIWESWERKKKQSGFILLYVKLIKIHTKIHT